MECVKWFVEVWSRVMTCEEQPMAIRDLLRACSLHNKGLAVWLDVWDPAKVDEESG